MMFWLWTLLTTLTFAGPDASVQDRIVKAFSVRHGAPTCEQVASWAGPDEVSDVMRNITTTVTMPPWVPMKAAQCVIRSASTDPESWALVQRWMTDESTMGFSLVAIQNIDRFDDKKAKKLGQLAVQRSTIEPRFQQLVTPYMKGSKHPSIVDLSKQLEQP
jgi:hypothetical protein